MPRMIEQSPIKHRSTLRREVFFLFFLQPIFDLLCNVCRSMTDGWSQRQRNLSKKKSKGSQLLHRVSNL